MPILTMKELLETGVHFGHRTQRWNPKMEKYIFTERKGVHIVDLESTQRLFDKAYDLVREEVRKGKEILFVGTKRQVRSIIAEQGSRCGAHYVNHRWLGGALTNFDTIRESVEKMLTLERMSEDGTFEQLPNKEVVKLRREMNKMKRNYDGIRDMTSLPDLMYVIDPEVEEIAVHEANILDIPVIAITDTNCDPDFVDYPIPGNDDAIKATKLLTSRLADAVIEGREGMDQAAHEEKIAQEEEVEEAASEPDQSEEEGTGEVEEEAEEPETVEAEASEEPELASSEEG